MSRISDVRKIEKPTPVPKIPPLAPRQPTPTPESSTETKTSRMSWQTPEYPYYEKTTDWYWALGIIGLAMAGVALYERNFIFLLMIIVGVFTVLLYATRKPKTITVLISSQGVQIDDRLFPYETLQSFWIFYRLGDVKELSLKTTSMVMNTMKIPLGDSDPVLVRSLLLRFLSEKSQEESLVDTLMRRIGF